MKLTIEQRDAIDTLKNPEVKQMTINAVSGAGKTFLLTKIAEELNITNGLYLAYNSAITTEARKIFRKTPIVCKTSHALAYAAVITPNKDKYNKEFQNFSINTITERTLSKDEKIEVVRLMNLFCSSADISIDKFLIKNEVSPVLGKIIEKYLQAMESGTIAISHAFYLKYYYILLVHKLIKFKKPYDIIMIDEAGDLNPVTFEIFNLLPAKQKILVGDEYQNIYSFNNTINGFAKSEGKAVAKRLTQSFRVSDKIAASVEYFIKTMLHDDKFTFKGVHYDEGTKIVTKAIITRTNEELISLMIDFVVSDTKFQLRRPIEEIFSLPLSIINLNSGKAVDSKYRHIQIAADEYRKNIDILNRTYKSLYGYLSSKFSDDSVIKSAISLIAKHGSKTIFNTYFGAKKLLSKSSNLTICTAHCSKGLEFDQVTISDGLNNRISKVKIAMEKNSIAPLDEESMAKEIEEIRLYYVAVTRVKIKLINAAHLIMNISEFDSDDSDDSELVNQEFLSKCKSITQTYG